MGYPMTYQRVIGRNRLSDGNYTQAPIAWHASGTAIVDPQTLEKDVLVHVIGEWKKAINDQAEAFNGRLRLLVGDLRRLELDTIDEGSINAYIAQRTGLDQEIVAAVLKEFMNW